MFALTLAFRLVRVLVDLFFHNPLIPFVSRPLLYTCTVLSDKDHTAVSR